MFTAQEYLSGKYDVELYTIRKRNEDFLVRRMNGIEALKLEGINSPDERIIHVLANCLYDGSTRRAIGNLKAHDFTERYGGLAVDVGLQIITDTNEFEYAEQEKAAELEKNSVRTNTQSSTGNTASGSDSTPSEPVQVKIP